jgi:glutamate synthase (ferredoxin)
MSASLVVETAQIWSTHHVATLIGYGASAVHPYMLFRVATQLTTPPAEGKKAKAAVESNIGIENARNALKAGVLKIMSKIGISTLSSYHGAQIFECIGLHPEVVDVAFKGTASRVGGLDFSELQKETASLVKDSAYGGLDADDVKVFKLSNYGFINALQKGRGGEEHANSPRVAKLLHASVREDDPVERKNKYNDFVKELTETAPFGLRDLLQFKWAETPADADISLREITERFVTGGMSLGALSRETHESLAMAMNRLGAASNSGEGGEDKVRNDQVGENRDTTWKHLRGKSIVKEDIAQSQIRQVASGRFGVTAPYLAAAAQIEIKVAQGAKPGEGGQLPGQKVDSYIASVRAATEGVTLISPPPHHDIYSIEDLAQLIFDLKAINPKARISVKLVSIIGIGTVACGVAKAGADVIQISGHDGGSGAAAISSIKHAGAPVELGLAESHTTLVENGLRDLVTVRADGGVRTGADVVKLALLGAEEFGFGTVAMVAAGCVMARVCHTNNCPVGVATQKEKLRARVRGEPEDVTRYFESVAEETADILKRLGLKSLREAVGRIDLLELLDDLSLSKTTRFDVATTVLKPIEKGLFTQDFVAPAEPAPSRALLCPAGIHFDDQYVGEGKTISKEPYYLVNTDRAVGTRLAGDIARRQRAEGKIQPVELKYTGAAGQSFMAFAVSEMKVSLEGDANDYVCKGLSGAHVSIFPPREAEANGVFEAKNSVIIGNTCLYGATSGKFFAAGQSGDRFGVRNSGVQAVIEGAGDHCCEYMTNGVVLVLGPTGINVGSGMTGGVAYLYDPSVNDDMIAGRLKLTNVKPRRVQDGSPAADTIQRLLREHHEATASKHAKHLLENFDASHFCQVVPPSEEDKPHHAVVADSVEEMAVSR